MHLLGNNMVDRENDLLALCLGEFKNFDGHFHHGFFVAFLIDNDCLVLRGTHVDAGRLHECVGHGAADENFVHKAQEILDDENLVTHLGSA